MKRTILLVLLGIGTVSGYAAGCAHARHGWQSRHDAMERHVAQLCADAALGAKPAAAAPQAQ